MAHYYQVVHSMDEIKNIYPHLNIENGIQLVMGDDVQFGGQQVILTQDQPPELNLIDNNQQHLQQIVYAQPQPGQMQPHAETQYIIQDDSLSDPTYGQPTSQPIYYSEVQTDNSQLLQSNIVQQQPPHDQQQQMHTIQQHSVDQQMQQVPPPPPPVQQQPQQQQQQQQVIIQQIPRPGQQVIIRQSPEQPPHLVPQHQPQQTHVIYHQPPPPPPNTQQPPPPPPQQMQQQIIYEQPGTPQHMVQLQPPPLVHQSSPQRMQTQVIQQQTPPQQIHVQQQQQQQQQTTQRLSIQRLSNMLNNQPQQQQHHQSPPQTSQHHIIQQQQQQQQRVAVAPVNQMPQQQLQIQTQQQQPQPQPSETAKVVRHYRPRQPRQPRPRCPTTGQIIRTPRGTPRAQIQMAAPVVIRQQGVQQQGQPRPTVVLNQGQVQYKIMRQATPSTMAPGMQQPVSNTYILKTATVQKKPVAGQQQQQQQPQPQLPTTIQQQIPQTAQPQQQQQQQQQVVLTQSQSSTAQQTKPTVTNATTTAAVAGGQKVPGQVNDLEDLEDSILAATISKQPQQSPQQQDSPQNQPTQTPQPVQQTNTQQPPVNQYTQMQQQQQPAQVPPQLHQQQQQQQPQQQIQNQQHLQQQQQQPPPPLPQQQQQIQTFDESMNLIQLPNGQTMTCEQYRQFQEKQQRQQQENIRGGFTQRGGYGRGQIRSITVKRTNTPINRPQMHLQQQPPQPHMMHQQPQHMNNQQHVYQHQPQMHMQPQQQHHLHQQPHMQQPPPPPPQQQQQHDVDVRERESAKMLCILQSGEQRLITFTLPKESCTVQELLEQVGVQFSPDSNIQCISNPGGDIDYIVTVGVTIQQTNEYLKAAENTIKNQNQQQQQQQQQQTQMQHHQQQIHPQQHQLVQRQIVQQTQLAQPQPIQQQLTLIDAQIDSKKEPPLKLVKGFLAVCSSCGYTGVDFAKCQRCKRIFTETPRKVAEPEKIISSTQPPPLVPTGSALTTTVAGTATATKIILTEKTEKEKKNLEMLQKKHQMSIVTTVAARGGRGGIVRGRGRGRGALAKHDVEPVVFTLSSDDEDDTKVRSSTKANLTAKSAAALASPKKEPLSSEPIVIDDDEVPTDFVREDITDVKNIVGGLFTILDCRTIRIGTLKFDATEKVTISSKGMRIIAPNVKRPGENSILDIQLREIVKILAHFSKSLFVMFIYTLPSTGTFIRESLEMGLASDNLPYFNPGSRTDETHKRITLVMERMTEESKQIIRTIFTKEKIEEISTRDANELLIRSCNTNKPIGGDNTLANSSTQNSSQTNNEETKIRKILIYPPGKGGISINTEDYMCLAIDQYLNDVIIDFYLNYLRLELLKGEEREKVYIFSTFFYKRLTTMTSRQRAANEKDAKLTAAQKRHARVASWTKKDNIFEKDYIIIPINEQSHWFLAIICFPNLEGPITMGNGNVPTTPVKKSKKARKVNMSLQIGSTTITPVSKREIESINLNDDELSERDEAEGDDSELASDNDETDDEITSVRPCIKQPCILIFDSLTGASRSRVVATLRDYLTCEYKAKMLNNNNNNNNGNGNGPTQSTPQQQPRIFNKNNMPGHCVKVPQQNNFTDCGLYLLQYVEHFFIDPIRDYHIPIKHLQDWFETITVTKKREDISNLLKDLIKEYDKTVLPLPDIKFPTLNGKLIIDPDDSFNDETAEFEEEELEEEEDEDEEEADISNNSDKIAAADSTATVVTVASADQQEPTSTGKVIKIKKITKRSLDDKQNGDSDNRKTPRITE
uniref:Putative sentrin/sumo-specific protease senp7 n=1 Tax=Corethrella appendiculata TaxID=1370023 RepID=W4VR71_9DIPT